MELLHPSDWSVLRGKRILCTSSGLFLVHLHDGQSPQRVQEHEHEWKGYPTELALPIHCQSLREWICSQRRDDLYVRSFTHHRDPRASRIEGPGHHRLDPQHQHDVHLGDGESIDARLQEHAHSRYDVQLLV